MATLNQVMEGMQILSKYVDPSKHNVYAEHDTICVGGDLSEWIDSENSEDGEGDILLDASPYSQEDIKRLNELGWIISENYWTKFT